MFLHVPWTDLTRFNSTDNIITENTIYEAPHSITFSFLGPTQLSLLEYSQPMIFVSLWAGIAQSV
jgi:hypothetical protein